MAHYSKEELDKEFEQFMKELSDDSFENSNKTPRQPKREVKKKDTLPWWITEGDFEDGGRLGTNVSYLKTKVTSQPIMEIEEESAERIQFLKSSGTSILSIDSLETNERVVSELNHSVLGLGLDTFEEKEEKEQFFARLEKGLTSSIDYSRLNKELDSNESTQFKALHSNQANIELTEDKHENESKFELAENYSDDFEDEEDIDGPLTTKDEETNSKENSKSEKINAPKQEEEKTGMLANVVLLDSFDSVAEVNLDEQGKATTMPKVLPEIADNEMTGTGVSYGQSNSDIEALHQAYCHIAHSLGNSDEQRIEIAAMENVKSSEKGHPQENEESSKNISTTESDLPTVEELMKTIKIDSFGISGLDLQPISYKKQADSKETEVISPLPFKMKPNVSQEPQNVNQLFDKNEENVVLQKTTNESIENCCPRVNTTEECIDKMYLDILRKKLSVAPSVLPQEDKIKKTFRPQLSSGEGAVIGKEVPFKKARSTPPLAKRKPQSSVYASVRSSGYGKPSSPCKTSTLEKKTSKDMTKSKNLRSILTSNQARKKEILSETKLKPAALGKPAPKTESCLATPKKSEDATETGSCIHFQNDSSGYRDGNMDTELILFKRVQEAEEKWKGAQAVIEQIKVTFSEKERELENKMEELKRQQEKELFKLSQDNYILQTKLNSFGETNKKQRWLHVGETTDPVTEEKLKQIQKEIQEQETLLQGYQQENERLYNQVKDLQEQNKKNEERMFKENQSLFSELASLKEQMQRNRFLSQVVEDSEPTRNQNFTDLLTELRVAQKEKNSLLEDIKRLKQDKQALEVDLEKMKKDRDHARDQVAYVTGEKLYEIKILEETHKQEISRLQKRIQWYAENQELLDKDAVRLKEANEEIERLKLEAEKLKAEFGNPSLQKKTHLKDKAADAKKIQDLERQVKEMEGILKRRYPNSLPALILAASAAGDTVDRNTVEFMEKRIKKLEADLEGKDEEAKRSLRTMEQEFQKMKIQYEQRLEEQEQLLAHKLKAASQNQHDNSSRVKALEKELHDIKEAHEITVRNLEAEIDTFKQQNAELELKKNRDDKDFQSIEFQVEQAHAKAKLARLNEELAAKGREIQDLSKTVEKLQKERRMMLSSQHSKGREEMTAKRVKKEVSHAGKGSANSFPGTLDGKLYQPHTFTDSHISEVLQENCRLKNELEKVIVERNELKMKSDIAMNQFENSMKRVKEDTAAHITSLKASHQREIEKLLCQNAVENSSSKVAELNRKIATQEVLIKHFQNQVNELQDKQESLIVSQVREEILQKEITKLLEELREAKENHTPEMKHFMGLEKKIKQMEMRHKQREQELQQIIQQTHQVVETEQNKEIEKWKRLAQLKNRELDKFRTELDSILDVLRELQRQGVVVPVAFAEEVTAPQY
ncbi:Protein QN1 like protein [Myotis brandtii]|uniref:Centrosomal protein of 162 kDa n=3 Tax=Myotis brandtii TaxID=109478 RepID=S7PNT7_MYOBR|nr:PREDICTED: centrosomal protein of 162 kDa isoform X1 [Myotis brandtii]XP_005870013.1 PREDICTED: centrosomal protein of 162 kDa isoform X1 [Myotis brandtii]EPQ10032.1 Protein QN1 like protein [Myotis brandtii]